MRFIWRESFNSQQEDIWKNLDAQQRQCFHKRNLVKPFSMGENEAFWVKWGLNDNVTFLPFYIRTCLTEVKNLLKGNFDDHPKKRIGRATRGHEPTMIILDYSQTFAISHLKFKVELKTILASTVYSILSDSVSFWRLVQINHQK